MSADDPTRDPAPLRDVFAHRISTGEESGNRVEETVSAVLEAPLVLDVEGVETYTLLCTPDDKRALAAGFLLTEGIVDDMADVVTLRECEDDPSVMRIRLRQPIPRIGEAGRNLLIVSSCGLCGAEGLDEKLNALTPVGNTLRVDGPTLRSVGQRLGKEQPLFDACGSTHAAGIFTADGDLIATAEDTGRHNALDKAIGRCLLAGWSPIGRGAVLSGRVSLEMVGKCAKAGIELISAISGPTSLAIDVAERCGITLCAFVRETRATIFTHPERITPALPVE